MDPSLKQSFLKWKMTAAFVLPFIIAAIFIMSKRQDPTFSLPQPIQSLKVDSPIPAQIQLMDPNGQMQMISLEDKNSLLVFWAEWCGVCRSDLPSLIQLKKRLEGFNIQILFVNLDGESGLEGALNLWDSWGGNRDDFWMDPNHALKTHWQVNAIPQHWLISDQLELIHKSIGRLDWLHPESMNHFSRLLKPVKAN